MGLEQLRTIILGQAGNDTYALCGPSPMFIVCQSCFFAMYRAPLWAQNGGASISLH